MKKQQRSYTILLIKDDESPVKRILFKQRTLQLGLCLSLVFILALSLFLTDYLNLYVDKFKISRLEKENQNWAKKFSLLEFQVKNLEDQVQQASQFSKKIQLITNNNLKENLMNSQRIGKIHSNSTLLALSTPSKQHSEEVSHRQLATTKTAQDETSSFSRSGELELRIEKLKGQAELTKQDTWSLYTSLLENRELLNNTPSLLPVKGWISSHFGYRNESPYSDHQPYFHRGMDIATSEGDMVMSSADGKVVFTGYDDSGFGNLIIVDHGYGLETYYAHLSEIKTEFGKKIKKGDVIGKVGSTGRSTGPHLHYEVRIYGVPVNPTNYITDSFEILGLNTHSH